MKGKVDETFSLWASKYISRYFPSSTQMIMFCFRPSLKQAMSIPEEDEQTADEYYMDIILKRHARKLFSNQRIRDLGMFAAHVDFKLTEWLRKER